jgi:hypothetical protein
MILEQIKDNLGLIASIITSSGVIGGALLWVGKKILNKTLKPFKEQMYNMEKARANEHADTIKRIDNVQLLSDKNFLVSFLAKVENGLIIDEVEKERFYEVYKDYTDLGGNSYIKHKVEKLQKEGKL